MPLKTEKYPWRTTLRHIKERVNRRDGSYYRKGIKCLITAEELKTIWFRDKAHEMDRPSIDRKNNSGDYTFKNCQYLEYVLNTKKRDLDTQFRKSCSVNCSNNLKRLWQDPEYRKKRLEGMSKQALNQWKNPKFRKLVSYTMKKEILKRLADPIFRQKQRESVSKKTGD